MRSTQLYWEFTPTYPREWPSWVLRWMSEGFKHCVNALVTVLLVPMSWEKLLNRFHSSSLGCTWPLGMSGSVKLHHWKHCASKIRVFESSQHVLDTCWMSLHRLHLTEHHKHVVILIPTARMKKARLVHVLTAGRWRGQSWDPGTCVLWLRSCPHTVPLLHEDQLTWLLSALYVPRFQSS